MVKKYYLLGIISYFLIPVVMMAGSAVTIFINPEIAAGHPDYERNYRLLAMAKSLSFAATLLMGMALWFLTCIFLVKARQRSYRWVLLAFWGPLGFIGLTMLGDKAPAPRDFHQQFIGRQKPALRIAYEIAFFVAVWVAAYLCMVVIRNLIILSQAVRTGTSIADVITQQNASSGMWAFSEGMEVLYLVVACYLVWPLFFNLIARLPVLRNFFSAE